MRRQAARPTLAIAEYFRDEGKDVLVLMHSVTRFVIAPRDRALGQRTADCKRLYAASLHRGAAAS
jgi:flagellar biosynthesis/type III secretory pathway ATPase